MGGPALTPGRDHAVSFHARSKMNHIATDIGSRLRQARETRGLALADIAAATKISMTALVAMEHNDFARLPGGVFRRAYVKAFAAEVGLNADELARDYLAMFETEPANLLLRDAVERTPRAFRHPLPAISAIVGFVIFGWLIVECAQVVMRQ